MASVLFFNRRFTPKLWGFFLALFFGLLFLRLGFWQLERAAEKKQLLQAMTSLEQQEAITWSSGQPLPKQYQPIRVQGHFLPMIFLLDNQHQDHRFGYDVLSPLQLADKRVVLVDRGWIPGDRARLHFPTIYTPSELVQLQGYAYFPSKNNWILGPEWEEKGQNLMVIERINAKLIRQILQKSVYPFIIRLGKKEPNGFLRHWAVVSMPPERHLGYALQWFVMALVVLVLFLALSLKKIDEKKSV